MKLVFCLPAPVRKPSGGHKVIYEYANRLVAKGYKVTIVYDCSCAFNRNKIIFNVLHSNTFLLKLIYKFLFSKKKRWFELDEKIEEVFALNGINNSVVPDSDVVIATAAETANSVCRLDVVKGRKFYFIQGVEDWGMSEDELINTYRLNFDKIIAVSKGIAQFVQRYIDSEVEIIPNGLDTDIFFIKNKIENRNPYSVAMLYHKLECKGSKYGIEALKRIKERVPNLEAHLFGIYDRPVELESWMKYTKNANKTELLEIYNSCALFLCPSIQEGFGLTGAESMCCGCALATTINLGSIEYAKHNCNSIMFPPADVDKMVEAIYELLANNNKRILLAKQGNIDIQQYSWENSVEKFCLCVNR